VTCQQQEEEEEEEEEEERAEVRRCNVNLTLSCFPASNFRQLLSLFRRRSQQQYM
jgi:hypothetical protein